MKYSKIELNFYKTFNLPKEQTEVGELYPIIGTSEIMRMIDILSNLEYKVITTYTSSHPKYKTMKKIRHSLGKDLKRLKLQLLKTSIEFADDIREEIQQLF